MQEICHLKHVTENLGSRDYSVYDLKILAEY